jgi:hypothetical protein
VGSAPFVEILFVHKIFYFWIDGEGLELSSYIHFDFYFLFRLNFGLRASGPPWLSLWMVTSFGVLNRSTMSGTPESPPAQPEDAPALESPPAFAFGSALAVVVPERKALSIGLHKA